MQLPHAVYDSARCEVQQNFWEIKAGEVACNHGFNARTILGSRQMHYIRSVCHSNVVLLKAREYSCFCKTCAYCGQGPYSLTRFVEDWKLLIDRALRSIVCSLRCRVR